MYVAEDVCQLPALSKYLLPEPVFNNAICILISTLFLCR